MSLGGSPPASGALRARVLGAMLAAVLLVLPGVAFSQTLGPNGMPVCTADSAQIVPAVTPDDNGGSIITWQDYRDGSWDIYAQRVNASGVSQWTMDGVTICMAGGDQQRPQIVGDASGGAIIVWQDYRDGNWDIYAQRVNSSGEAQWALDGIPVCSAVFDQLGIALIGDGLGGAILTWEDNRSNVVDCPDIYAQRLDATGAGLWTADGVCVCNEASAQHGPRLVSDNSGGAFITWYDHRAGDYDIYTQRVASAGAVQWTTNGVATCTMGTDQLKPDICSDGADGVIITWYDYRSTTDYNIYAQRVGPSGAIVWVVDGIVMNNNVAYDQINPRIVSDGVGGALIAWQDYVTGTTSDIYAQRVAAAGAVLWTATGVTICTAAGDQRNPQIVTDGNSGAFVTWEDLRDSANCDIYAQRIAADAAITWPATGYLICDADSNQTSPTMASDGDFGAVIAWRDCRNGSCDIYAQGVNVSGSQAHDVGCTRILAPTGIVDIGDVVTPACSVYNYGTGTETYNTRMRIGTAYDQTASVPGHAAGTYAYVTFPDWTALVQGNLAVTCSTELVTDGNRVNNSQTDSVTVNGHDVGCSKILLPAGIVDSGVVVTPACSVYNYGTTAETYSARMKIGAAYDQTAMVSGQAAGTYAYVTFPDWTALVQGSLAVACSTELADDADPTNDRLADSVFVAVRDVGATVILAPSGTVDSGTLVTPLVVVSNFGNAADSFYVWLNIGDLYSDSELLNLPAGGTDTVEFDDWTAGPLGTLATRCSTLLASDMYHVNDGCADTVRVVRPTAIEEVTADVPLVFTLNNPNPNPFSGRTEVRYGLPHASYVTLQVYSLAGNLLATLHHGVERAGYHSQVVTLPLLPGGVYYCRFQADGFTATRKLVKLD